MKNKKRKLRDDVGRVTDGSGNVFADLGLPNPEQELLKAQLMLPIYSIVKESGMKQAEMAKVLGVRRPQESLLMRNRAWDLSARRLMEVLTVLHRDGERAP